MTIIYFIYHLFPIVLLCPFVYFIELDKAGGRSVTLRAHQIMHWVWEFKSSQPYITLTIDENTNAHK